MTNVRNILQMKGNVVWTVPPNTTVLGALTLMAEKNVGALVVTLEEKVLGIISERDYARKVALRGKSSRDTSVREIMTSDPVCVSPDQSIEECMEIMNNRHVRHLPVLENNRLAGMITIRDAIKAVIAEKEHTIEQLESYIKRS